MTTHSSVIAWRIPGTGEPGGLPSMGSPESDANGDFSHEIKRHLLLGRKVMTNLGEGNGTPLQYSCLENPMDGGA